MRARRDYLLFVSAYLFCLTDALLFGYSMFNAMPFADELSLLLRLCASSLIFAKLIFDRFYSRRLLLCLFFVGVILLVVYVKSAYSHIFYLLIICLGIRGADCRKLISIDFRARMAVGIVIVVCGLTGVIENYVTYRTDSETLRYSMGFNHPNTFASLVLSLLIEDAWIRRRRATGLYTVVVWLLAGALYMITSNRTAVLIMAAFPVILFLAAPASEKKRKKSGQFVSALAFPAASLISFLMMLLCRSSELLAAVDGLLSNRFYNAAVVFSSYGIPLLGQRVTLVSVRAARMTNSSVALLDVAYLRLLIQAGPLVLLLLVILYGKAMGNAHAKGDGWTVLVMEIFMIFGMFESGFNNVFLNFTLLFAAKELFCINAERSKEVTLCFGK